MSELRPPVDDRATVSIVTGVIGCVPLSALFGGLALRRIKRDGLRGRGRAIAGLALSGLWVLAAVAAALWFAFGNDTLDSSGPFRVGDCIAEYSPSTPRMTVSPVSCSDPHIGEVFAIVRTEGFSTGQDVYDKRCRAELDEYARSTDGVRVFGWGPGSPEWKSGNRAVLCVAMTESPGTGSIKR
jgi:hypothetical protein